jgi:type IV pilus biogenesis protein CpaD/CtpE
MRIHRLIVLGGALGIMLMASACDLTTPSQVNTAKIKVKDKTITEVYSVDHVDLKHVAATARIVLRNGNKEVTMTVPYLPGGGGRAGDLAEAYKAAFAAQGVTHFSAELVAMTDSQDTDKAVVSYETQVAEQPESCSRIPGFAGADSMDDYNDYQYGCETETNLSRMIDDPTDLLGKANPPEANSRRNGPITDPYQSGTPNSPMKGMQASSIGTSQ